ncbi:MAG: hypothetical protein AABW50_03885 [Nanoarchaeota archaeon]
MPKKTAKKAAKKQEDSNKEIKKISQSEYEKEIIELAEKGLTAEKIGQALKNQEIHPKDYQKKISHILKEKNLYAIPDIKNIKEKLEKIEKHYKNNKQDKKSMREKDRVFAQLRKLKKYHNIPLK